MQKINKTTSAPLAGAFFVLSLAIMPFSLKIVGFTVSLNPSLLAVVDVWNQIAGSYGGGHQPVTSAELLAISNLDSNETSDVATEGNSLLARLDQDEPAEMYLSQFSAVEIEEINADAPRARTPKTTSHATHSVKRAGVDSYYREVRVRIERHAEALKAAEVAQREMAEHVERLKGLDKPLAGIRFDFVKLFKNIPVNKDVKVLLRVKPSAPVVPKLTACDLRTTLTGGKNSSVSLSEARARVAETAVTSFENCEL
ncbi:MAG TPA: hypothetical protein VF762_05205 [Blastocatellia bacterium]|jgi:hypothetical protein